MKTPKFYRMFEYNKNLLPNSYLADLEEDVHSIEAARKKTGASIGYPGWGLLYHLLISHLDRAREEIIIETGTNWGSTTIVLAQALIDAGCRGRVITCELDEENIDRAKLNWEAAGVSGHIEFHQGDSIKIVPRALAELTGIRFAFIDASHLYNDVKNEFEIILPKLADDALVIFDNTYRITDESEDPRVNGFVRDLPQLYGGNLINLEFVSWFTPGLAIWQKQGVL